MFAGMRDSKCLRGAALMTLTVGVVLLLGSWDGLYDRLDLPQGLPALSTQIGGAGMTGLAVLLWTAAAKPEVAATAALSGSIALGGGALVIAAWLIFQDPEADLGIDTLGTVILSAVALLFALGAIVLGRLALGSAQSSRR
jgi:hypothetical protein